MDVCSTCNVNMTLRINTVREDTGSEGPGRRFCVWVQGCSRHCPGCFAEDLWDLRGGYELSVDDLCGQLDRRLTVAPVLEGITLLGGEPFEQAEALARFSAHARAKGLSVFCFSGYTLAELESGRVPGAAELLAQVDVLAAGPYVRDERDFSRPWVGSRNQEFFFLTDRYEADSFLSARNRVEVRLRRDGSISLNGMAAFFDRPAMGDCAPQEKGSDR